MKTADINEKGQITWKVTDFQSEIKPSRNLQGQYESSSGQLNIRYVNKTNKDRDKGIKQKISQLRLKQNSTQSQLRMKSQQPLAPFDVSQWQHIDNDQQSILTTNVLHPSVVDNQSSSIDFNQSQLETQHHEQLNPSVQR